MSFNEWHRVSIKDVFELIPGFAFKSKDFSENGIPVIKIKNVKALRLLDRDFSYIDPKYLETKSRFTTKKGDLLISMTGNRIEGSMSSWVGKVCRINSDKKYLINQRVGILRLSNESYSDKFFLYLLGSEEIQKKLISIATSSGGQANISPDQIKSLEFSIPCFEEQNAIAHILSTLDDKIEVNSQINRTLENMAQTIFKQWFVDFEFPNEDGEPYKSSGGEMVESELGMIPKGWEVISLDKIVDVRSGYSYKGTDLSESNNAMVTIKNFDRNGGYKKDGLKEIIISDRVKKHHYIEINDVVVAHTDLTQGAEIIGNPVMVLSKGKYEKLIMSMDVVKVISKDNDIDNAFIYCLLKTDNFKQYALGYVNGTTVLHLSKKAIPQYKLPFPTDIKICKELSAILKTIMMKISLSDNENDNLNLTRDILLPKLMSGEIRVPLDEEGAAS